MFCKRTYYALILMIELAQGGKSGEVGVDDVVHTHHIRREALDEIVGKLKMSRLIVGKENGELQLAMPPQKITIWEIVVSVAGEGLLPMRFSNQSARPGSVFTMLNKEQDIIRNMVSARLKRQKLSTWSERASKIVYV